MSASDVIAPPTGSLAASHRASRAFQQPITKAGAKGLKGSKESLATTTSDDNKAAAAAAPRRKASKASTESSSTAMSSWYKFRNSLPRMSIQRGSISGRWAPFSRANLTASGHIKVPVQYENTFRTEPSSDERFKSEKMRGVAEDCLNSFLQYETYDAAKCSSLAKSISEQIKKRVTDELAIVDFNLPSHLKADNRSRYKIICCVTISQSPEFISVSKCLCDAQTDDYVTAQFRNSHMTAVATVFAMYTY